jgi:hypothetical protein
MQQLSTMDLAWSPFAPPQSQPQPAKGVEGIEIVEVATSERLSTHDLGLIEMVAGSSTDNSAESSASEVVTGVCQRAGAATCETYCGGERGEGQGAAKSVA